MHDCEWKGFNLLKKAHFNLYGQAGCEVGDMLPVARPGPGVLSDPTVELNGSALPLTALSTLS